MNRIWIVGRSGQIGSALVRLLGERTLAPALDQLDLSFPERISDSLDRLEAASGVPSAIINAAAYTHVDRAESDEATADRINAFAPEAIARWCRGREIAFVHYSTDYVYSGEGTSPWREDDPTGPLSVYGRSKLRGDRLVESSGARYLILRTSWVYDADGRNFVNTMLALGRSRDTLRVVADQVGAPSYAPHLARLTSEILQKAMQMHPFPSGVYHLAPEGETTWHRFAEEIFSGARRKGFQLTVRRVEPIATVEYPTPARRPLNSRLDKTKLLTTFDVRLPSWQDGLNECLAQKALQPEDARPLT